MINIEKEVNFLLRGIIYSNSKLNFEIFFFWNIVSDEREAFD